jgi:hypothetical protein
LKRLSHLYGSTSGSSTAKGESSVYPRGNYSASSSAIVALKLIPRRSLPSLT